MRRRKFLGVLGGATSHGHRAAAFVLPRMICATLLALGLSGRAGAQLFEGRALPPDEILTILHMAGLDPVGQPKRSGTNYVIRAIEGGDRDVQVVIDANSGDILSKTPAGTASQIPPASHRTRSRGSRDAGAPIVDEDNSPSSFFRPLSSGAVPPPRSGNATRSLPRGGPMQADRDGDGLDLSKLNIIVDEPGRAGVSQPQERLPLPAGPTVSPNLSPKPVDRTAAVPPKPEPLPKLRPDPHIEAVPLPSPSPAESKRQPASLPMPPVPPRTKPSANTDESDRDGVLPPPPAHLPQRVGPAVSPNLLPKPVDRTAAVPPRPEPLPKLRPDAPIEAVPLPPPAESKRQPPSLPMPPSPPRSSNATRQLPGRGTMQPNADGDASAPAKPSANTDEPHRDGALPPPPERLPRRAAPAVSPSLLPKPVDRTAAVPPKPEPLPKPQGNAPIEATPLPSPQPPLVSTRRPVSAPMPLTPLSLSNAAPPPRSGTSSPNKSGHASAPSMPKVIMADPDPDDIPPAPENASSTLHSPH